jgi:hypothetical protein
MGTMGESFADIRIWTGITGVAEDRLDGLQDLFWFRVPES